jgi:DNA-binding GntR family transcriptional regulator
MAALDAGDGRAVDLSCQNKYIIGNSISIDKTGANETMATGQVKSLTEQIYLTIRSDILACRHRPSSRLRINVLCEELGASLGAVREALSRLAAEGFVQLEAQKGFRVKPVSLHDLEDLTRTRITIESMCLRRAIELGGVDWETGIVSAFHRLSRIPETETDGGQARLSETWATAHDNFHNALVAASDSEWLLRIRKMLFDQADRYRRLTAISAKRDRNVNAEHKAIMKAALARDGDAATRLIGEHLQRTASIVATLSTYEFDTVVA